MNLCIQGRIQDFAQGGGGQIRKKISHPELLRKGAGGNRFSDNLYSFYNIKPIDRIF